jgi:predicted peptidase
MSEDIPEQLPSYKTVTEVFDWGPAISKVIIKWPEEIESEMVDKNTFKVYARRILSDGALSPSAAFKKKM